MLEHVKFLQSLTCNSVQEMNLDKDSCMEPNPISEYILHIHICVTHQWKSAHMTWIFHLTICPNMFFGSGLRFRYAFEYFENKWKFASLMGKSLDQIISIHLWVDAFLILHRKERFSLFSCGILLKFCCCSAKPSTRFSLVDLFWRFIYRIILLH